MVRVTATAESFVLRAPLLPFDQFVTWGAGLEAPLAAAAALGGALGRDRARLRRTLADALCQPPTREALLVASPDLTRASDARRGAPESRRGLRTERALVRYFTRMTSRATPFGLFAGCAVGVVGEQTDLLVAPVTELRRRSTLDLGLVEAIGAALEHGPELRDELRLDVNPSAYRAAGSVRFIQVRRTDRGRAHHSVGVQESPPLLAVLERARAGAAPSALVSAAIAGGAAADLAPAYVRRLVDVQLLWSELALTLTGEPPLDALIARLRDCGESDWRPRLERARDRLREIDARPIGQTPSSYHAVHAELKGLPQARGAARLVHVDMIRPGRGVMLGRAVANELLRASETLCSISQRAPGLTEFREAFVERYGEQFVRLAVALDADIGIGFPVRAPLDEPLLRGLRLFARVDPPAAWRARDRHLLIGVQRAVQQGSREIELSDDDIRCLAAHDPPAIPDAFSVHASLAARTQAAARGWDAHIIGVSGPSGATALGRFCHADPELREQVERHLRAEEALQPDAVFAEVTHLPEAGVGNLVARPLLRRWEIPVVVRSGAPPVHQLPIDDLYVGVQSGRLSLWSARLDRQVLPRMSCALESGLGTSVANFLTLLADDFTGGPFRWSWGPLSAAPFLPRVRYGSSVFALARWRLTDAEIAELHGPTADACYENTQRLRQARSLPRIVVLCEADMRLPVDLDNALSVEAFVSRVRTASEVVLTELWPEADRLSARGPAGRYTSEVIVPFVRQHSVERLPAHSRTLTVTGPRRPSPPGSDWLFVKLYTGPASADRVLRAVAERLPTDLVDRWFFIRFRDPDHHLRLRLHGEPGTLWHQVLPAVQRAVEPMLTEQVVWRFSIDTYEPEVESYGGPAAMATVERIFHADTLCVLELLAASPAGAPPRWQLALQSVDMLLDDLIPDAASADALLRSRAATLGTIVRADDGVRRRLAARLREHEPQLSSLLMRRADGATAETAYTAPLLARSQQLAPLIGELHQLERSDRLTQPVSVIAHRLLHMHLNRLLRDVQLAQEFVLYDFLIRLRAARAARARGLEHSDRGDR